jgi:isocitrate lyase
VADSSKETDIQLQINNHETHVAPIAAGFVNAEASYLMSKQIIKAGGRCLEIYKPSI